MMSYICRTLAYVCMGISLPLHLDSLRNNEEYDRTQTLLGTLFVVVSGFFGALIPSFCIGSAFDIYEKRIQIY